MDVRVENFGAAVALVKGRISGGENLTGEEGDGTLLGGSQPLQPQVME